MIPLTFLAGMLLMMLGAYIAHLLLRRRRATCLRNLASRWRMQYAPNDRFQITSHVVSGFPIPGASDLVVVDLIYRQEPHCYRYIFTVQYTEGVVRTKNRITRAGSIAEPRDKRSVPPWGALRLGSSRLPLMQQYVELYDSLSGDQPGDSHL